MEQPCQLKKGQAGCPWCGALRISDATFRLPMIFECNACGGMWVMTTPPAAEQKKKQCQGATS